MQNKEIYLINIYSYNIPSSLSVLLQFTDKYQVNKNRNDVTPSTTVESDEHSITADNTNSNFDKFALLMWKNGVIQYRHKVQTIIEIVVPVLFSLILVWIRSLVHPHIITNNTTYELLNIETLTPLRLVF